LLRQLDSKTLALLAELLAAGKGKGDLANQRGIDPQSIRISHYEVRSATVNQ